MPLLQRCQPPHSAAQRGPEAARQDPVGYANADKRLMFYYLMYIIWQILVDY